MSSLGLNGFQTRIHTTTKTPIEIWLSHFCTTETMTTLLQPFRYLAQWNQILIRKPANRMGHQMISPPRKTLLEQILTKILEMSAQRTSIVNPETHLLRKHWTHRGLP